MDPFSTAWEKQDPDYYQAEPSNLPIRAIRVGPGNDFAAEKVRLRRLLDAKGYPKVEILKSKSPLR